MSNKPMKITTYIHIHPNASTLQRLLVISSGATEPIAKQVMYVYMYYVNHEASRSGLSETQITSRWLASTGATKPNAIYGAKTI